MTTTHTPGPWRAVQHETLASYTITAPNQNGDGLSELIAHGIDSPKDARLIAKAPEMLESLRDLAAAAEDFAVPNSDTTYELRAELSIARAIITEIDGSDA